MKKFRTATVNFICMSLLLIAPILVESRICVLLWGEPEIPDSLK